MNTIYKHSSIIIKIVLVAVLIAFLITVYAQNNAKDVPMSTIDKAFQKQTSVTTMKKCNSRELMEFMGIDSSQYEGFMYYKSKNALGVSEVLVLKAHKGTSLSGAEDAGLPCTCVLPYDGGGINILYPLHQLIVYVWIAHFLNIAIDKDIHLCIIICTKSERVQ